MENKILVGSTYFFKDVKGFNSKDVDHVIIEKKPKKYKRCYQISGKGKCLFKWKQMSVDEYIDITLKSKLPMEAGKFLVKEVVDSIGMTIEDLKRLAPVFEKMDPKHTYLKIIYDSYIENGGFVLSDEQRMKAYEDYCKAREGK